jgi:membrane fusion protein (multidrug efflux system)
VVQRQELLMDDNGASVFVLAGGKAVKRAVTLGHEQGPEIELTGGLRAGENLIVESLNLLSDGVKVRAIAR